jgi:hypothetical protein
MQTQLNMENVKLVLRQEICLDCGGRTAEDAKSPTIEAKCEPTCPLIVKLPRLVNLVREGEPPCGYELFLKSLQQTEPAGYGPNLLQALSVLESIVCDASKKLESVKL